MAFPRLNALIIALTSFVMVHVNRADEPSVRVHTSTTTDSPIRLVVSNLDEPMVLQGSDDMKSWQDLFMVGPPHNGKEITAPVVSETTGFFRLVKLSAPLKLRSVFSPGSFHLATITNDREIEINLFGTRDAEGYPLKVTKIAYRVGERTVIADDEASVGPPSQKTGQPENEDNPVTAYLRGYVIVNRNGPCPLPAQAPKVSFNCREYRGELPPYVLSNVVATEYVPELSEGSNWTFSFAVPVAFQRRLNVETDMERWDRALEAAIIPGSVDLASNATLSAAAFGYGGRMPIQAMTYVRASGFFSLLGGIVMGAQAGSVLFSEPSPYDERADGFGEALDVDVQAFLMSGDRTYRFASQKELIRHPTVVSTEPILLIDSTCENRIVPVFDNPNQSHVRNIQWITKGGNPRDELQELDNVQQFPAEKISSLSLTDPTAQTYGRISAVATNEFLTITSTNSILLGVPGQFAQSDSDSNIVFKISPGPNSLPGNKVLVELSAETNGPDLDARVDQSNNVIMRLLRKDGTVRGELFLDQVYILHYYHRTGAGATMPPYHGKISLRLLGQELPP